MVGEIRVDVDSSKAVAERELRSRGGLWKQEKDNSGASRFNKVEEGALPSNVSR